MIQELLNNDAVKDVLVTVVVAVVGYLATLLRGWLLSLTKVQELLKNEKLIEILKKIVDGYILLVERDHPELSGLQREELVINMLVDYIKSIGLKNLLSDSELRAIVKTAYEGILAEIGQERFDKISEDNSNTN
jgi:ABC-type amino acid transport system permease subunit